MTGANPSTGASCQRRESRHLFPGGGDLIHVRLGGRSDGKASRCRRRRECESRSSGRPAVCRAQSKKWFGIRWRQRGADASESNLNLVFQRNVLIFFLLCSRSAGCCPVTGVAVWTCRQFIVGPHVSLSETWRGAADSEDMQRPRRHRLVALFYTFRVVGVIHRCLAVTHSFTHSHTNVWSKCRQAHWEQFRGSVSCPRTRWDSNDRPFGHWTTCSTH